MLSIIINPVSGGASLAESERRATIASAQLVASGEQGEVFLTERRGHGHDLAESAVRRGHRLVIAWGGDGTVNEIASALIGTTTALGIVPAGSGNGLARELKLPRTAPEAVAAALSGTPRRIDAGQLGGRWFFSIAGVGFDAHVADAFDRDIAGRRGLSTYARITARELWRYRPGPLSIDGAAPISPLLLTFANSAQFGNGARIAPCARIDDGLLDMVVFEERSRLQTMLELPRLFTGQAERVGGLTIRQITEAVVESQVPMMFHVDGEPVAGGTRVVARVHPGALWVIGSSEVRS